MPQYPAHEPAFHQPRAGDDVEDGGRASNHRLLTSDEAAVLDVVTSSSKLNNNTAMEMNSVGHSYPEEEGEAGRRRAGGGRSRRSRRPRKVVYYFSDSSDSDSDDVAVPVFGDDDDEPPQRRHLRRGADGDDGAKPLGGYGGGAACGEVDSSNAGSGGGVAAAADRVIVIEHRNRKSCVGGKSDRAGAAAGGCGCGCGCQEKYSITNPRIGSPTPIGFFAFGMATLLYNIHNAQIHPMNQAIMGMVIFYGGLTQFLCGWLELVNYNTLGCTISTTYGAFWMATAVMLLWPPNDLVQSLGDHMFTGGFFFLWFFFAGTLFASSFKSPLVCMLLFFCVMMNFFLQSVGYFSQSNTLQIVAGYEGIFVGALATYIGMAFTLADVYGRNLLPLFPHENFRNIKW